MVSMAIYDTDVRRIIMPKGPGTYGSQVGRPKKQKRKSLAENSERLYYESVGESVIDTYQRMGKLIMVNEVLPALLARGGAAIARGAAGIGRGVAGATKATGRAAVRGVRATGQAAERGGRAAVRGAEAIARGAGETVGAGERVPERLRGIGKQIAGEFEKGRRGHQGGAPQRGTGGEGRASREELRGNPNRPTPPRNI